MALIQTSAPSIEPVSLDEVKLHLRLSTATTTDDAILNSYISAARKQAENYTRRQICDAQWQLVLSGFPGEKGAIELPRPPLTTVSSEIVITYINSTFGTSTLASTFYSIDRGCVPPRVYPSKNSSNENSWGDLDLADVFNAVTVTYVSGYTSNTSSIAAPADVCLWIKMKVGQFYNYREPITNDDYRSLPNEHFNGLLDPYVVLGDVNL